jgi:hypothetical protein
MVAAVAVAVAIAGCGGGGGGSSSSSALSNAQYAQQLKGLLLPLGQSLQKLGSQASAATSKQELVAALDSADSAVKKAADDVQALNPPSGAASTNDDLASLLRSYEGSISKTEQTIKSGSKQEITSQVVTFRSDSSSFTSKLKQIKDRLISEGVKLPGGG